MAGTSKVETGPWITGSEAARRLGISFYRVKNLALMGLVATRALPGSSIEYSAVDIERLISERREGARE